VSPRARLALFGVAALGLAGLLASALVGLPDVGHAGGRYADLAVQAGLRDRHVANTVAGVVFDVRGFDTLGEELILFAAAVGTAVLLRARRGEGELAAAARRADEERMQLGGPARALAGALVLPVVVLCIYVVAHGNVSPGGGFQGGVLLAGVLLLVYGAGRVVALERIHPVALVEAAEAAGALAFALVAAGGVVFASVAMENFLPLGTAGEPPSGGTIAVLQAAVGVEVTGAIALVLIELFDQAMLRGREDV
jgi:multicomponent Na+:H+ antiporter subunit B